MMIESMMFTGYRYTIYWQFPPKSARKFKNIKKKHKHRVYLLTTVTEWVYEREKDRKVWKANNEALKCPEYHTFTPILMVMADRQSVNCNLHINLNDRKFNNFKCEIAQNYFQMDRERRRKMGKWARQKNEFTNDLRTTLSLPTESVMR